MRDVVFLFEYHYSVHSCSPSQEEDCSHNTAVTSTQTHTHTHTQVFGTGPAALTVISLHTCEGASSVSPPAAATHISLKGYFGLQRYHCNPGLPVNNRRSQDFTLPFCPCVIHSPHQLAGDFPSNSRFLTFYATALGWILILKQWTTVLCRCVLSRQPPTLTRDPAPAA